LALALSMPAAMSAEPATKSEPSRDETQQKLEAAQKRLDAAAREVADLSMSLSDDVMPEMMAFAGMSPQSAVLGVNIGSRRNSNRDDGVEILSVSPGGAAAEAGLKAGDVLTEVNGKPLKRDGDESPRSRLLAAMRDVDPEQKVAVKYVRDSKPVTANLVAQPAVRRLFSTGIPFPPGAMGAMGTAQGIEAIPNFAFMRADGMFGAAELVPLTPKLGQYFGVDKGLLVVRAPADTRLKLEEGDVIVDIDGRVPASPTHALRILGSYQAGEQLKLNVLRMKKRLSFDIAIPEDKWQRSIERSHFSVQPPHDVFMQRIPAIPAVPAQDAT
jgi:S1-C subfamily serine protease